MKTFLCTLLVLTFTYSHAADIFSYKLKDNEKYVNSFSVSLGTDATLHIVVVKNKESKMFDMLPFFMDATGQIIQLNKSSFQDEPELISYHKIGNTLTVLAYERRNLTVVDLELNNGGISTKEIAVREKPETVMMQESSSVVIIPELNGKKLEFITIENTQKITNKVVTVPENLQKDIDGMFESTFEMVDTQEFVQNGSIAQIQGYYEDGKFILVRDDKSDQHLEAFIINPESENAVVKTTYSTSTLDKIKESDNYMVGNKLFGMYLGKDDFGISVFDISSGTEEKNMLLSEEIAKIESPRNIKAYMEGATKSKMKPTITVNKTINNNYAVTIDYVEFSSYRYYNDWFWLHQMMMHQQMMMQQQNIMRPTGFGPNPMHYEIDAMFFEQKSTPLNFTLDQNLDLLSENEATMRQFVDKEKYMKSLNDNKNLKNPTAGFLENEYRYMYTDKKEEMVFIKTHDIIRKK